jgi:hypothetical protein
MLEDVMDDEDELKDFNLSSRVLREERRRLRERGRLERELEREREAYGSRDHSQDSVDGGAAEASTSGRNGNGAGGFASGEGSMQGTARGVAESAADAKQALVSGASRRRRRKRGGRGQHGTAAGRGGNKKQGGFLAWGQSMQPMPDAAQNDRGDLAASKPAGAAGKAAVGDATQWKARFGSRPSATKRLQAPSSNGAKPPEAQLQADYDEEDDDAAAGQEVLGQAGKVEIRRQEQLNHLEAQATVTASDDEDTLAAWCALQAPDA